MKIRKVIATVTLAALFFWTPSLVPVSLAPAPVRVALITAPCGFSVVNWRTADTANAAPQPFIPCPVGTGPKPWVVVGIGAGIISVILNAAIVSHTECRELSLNEAYASFFLPFVGLALNQHHNHCHH